MNKKVGKLSKKVIDILCLECEEMPIFLGDTNIEHMKNRHYDDYIKYGNDIKEIIKNPTYIARNPNQGSIEYIKEYKSNADNDVVLLAVRASHKQTLFIKTLFIMSERKKRYIFKERICKKILLEP